MKPTGLAVQLSVGRMTNSVYIEQIDERKCTVLYGTAARPAELVHR
jgi:hypothetical protein